MINVVMKVTEVIQIKEVPYEALVEFYPSRVSSFFLGLTVGSFSILILGYVIYCKLTDIKKEWDHGKGIDSSSSF